MVVELLQVEYLRDPRQLQNEQLWEGIQEEVFCKTEEVEAVVVAAAAVAAPWQWLEWIQLK